MTNRVVLLVLLVPLPMPGEHMENRVVTPPLDIRPFDEAFRDPIDPEESAADQDSQTDSEQDPAFPLDVCFAQRALERPVAHGDREEEGDVPIRPGILRSLEGTSQVSLGQCKV